MENKLREIVGELNDRLFAEYETDTELFESLTKIQSDSGLLYDDRPTSPLLRPHFLSRTQYDKISSASEKIAEAAERLTYAALDDEDLLERFDLTEMERRLVKVDPGYKKICVSSRLDTFIDGEDFKFLEYNAETPAGVGDQTPLEIVINRVPITKDFLAKNKTWKPKPHQKLLQALFKIYREFGGKKSKPNIAIVDWDGVSTAAEFDILKDYFESMGFQTLIADPADIDYDGEKLNAGTFEIDVVYKRVLIHELLERVEVDHPLIQAYLDGNLCIANSYRVKIPHKKMSFAIFTDDKYADIFTEEQLAVFRKHIPWTRKVENANTNFEGDQVDLLPFLRENRERFLLKPNDDYGGAGIVLGWETSDADWKAALAQASQDSFVVQEKASIEKHTFPAYSDRVYMEDLLVDFDPFLFLNEIEGGMVRLSSSSLVNVTQGGGQTALVILEDY